MWLKYKQEQLFCEVKSNLKSTYILHLPTELQQPARSTLLSPDRSVLKTFIFSTMVMRAVSVASPTFS